MAHKFYGNWDTWEGFELGHENALMTERTSNEEGNYEMGIDKMAVDVNKQSGVWIVPAELVLRLLGSRYWIPCEGLSPASAITDVSSFLCSRTSKKNSSDSPTNEQTNKSP